MIDYPKGALDPFARNLILDPKIWIELQVAPKRFGSQITDYQLDVILSKKGWWKLEGTTQPNHGMSRGICKYKAK